MSRTRSQIRAELELIRALQVYFEVEFDLYPLALRYNHNHGPDGKFCSGSGVDNSGESGIIDKKGLSFEEYAKDPSKLGLTTPNEKYFSYKSQGLDIRPLGNGNFKNISFEDGGGYRVFFDNTKQKTLMYHPEKRSHHSVAYYKLSEGKYGTKRFDIHGRPIKTNRRG